MNELDKAVDGFTTGIIKMLEAYETNKISRYQLIRYLVIIIIQIGARLVGSGTIVETG